MALHENKGKSRMHKRKLCLDINRLCYPFYPMQTPFSTYGTK